MHIDRDTLKALAALRLASPRFATGPRQGGRRAASLGRGVEFADYRPYAPGDDLRAVDWNVYARLDTALVRLFQEERNLGVHLCVDASASMDFGTPRKADHAAMLAAGLAAIALLHSDSVALGVCGGTGGRAVVRGQSEAALPEMIRLLERVEPDGVAAPGRDLQAQLQGQRPDRLVFLSDMLMEEAEREQTLRLLAASARQPVLLHVLSDEELHPDLHEPQHVVDAETGQELHLRGGREAQATYQAALAAFLDDLQARCRRMGILCVQAPTTLPVQALLVGLLRRSGLTESATGEAP